MANENDRHVVITDLANIANFKTAIKSDLFISRAFQLQYYTDANISSYFIQILV